MKLEKLTKRPRAARKDPAARRYDDACGAAHALDLIGERWALLVMRELMFGPKRFSDLRADLPGISANVLTQRLERLEEIGALSRRKLPPPAASHVYELTPWGYEIEPALSVLGRWAARSPLHDPTLPLSAASLMLSFKTMFDASRAKGLNARIGFRIGDETFLVHIHGGKCDAARQALDGADVVFAGQARAIAAAVYGGAPLEALEAEKALAIEGDRALAKRFTGLFPLPPKA
ncbi:helix-turn-helix domain-containing protein [Methylocystis sp. SC2]|uniref:winged helix-turn-helix transcriptional regulator n=1 Tax=Methylocystis sp. (strain SC2) TaxID=187303 RepID=UPI00027AF32E|nr:winged helix-turn-helix transcriptional regulator [Methylocystis sp. SC2]CCJ08402.1 Transcriptional regulator, HxlR family [Methylocystis sp. SC2]